MTKTNKHSNSIDNDTKLLMKNLMPFKKQWKGDIDFPITNNIVMKPENTYANDKIIWKNIELTQQYLRSINEDQRDEIAKDLLNFFYNFNFLKNYKYREKEINNAFQALKRNFIEVKIEDGEKYIVNAGSVGYKLFHHFFPNHIKTRGIKRRSIYDVITDKQLLWESIRNRIGNTLLYDKEHNKGLGYRQFPMPTTVNQHLIIGPKNSGLASMGSIFKAHVAKAIYNKYVNDGDNVLDYSCGFGTRLTGLMSCEKRNVKYFGYEPNTETYANLQKLISYFNFNAEIKCCGSEEECFNERMNFIFSSPPYFNVEQYCEESSQCYHKFPIYEDWIEKYWRATVLNIKNMLASNAVFAINIGGKSNSFMRKLENDLNNVIKEEGFKHFDTIWMKTSRSHFSKKQYSGKNFKLEGIFFYRM